MSLADEYKGWKEYWVAAIIGKELTRAQVEIVLADSLEMAFKHARRMWPWADAWEFLGHPDPNDREVAEPPEKRIIEVINRVEL